MSERFEADDVERGLVIAAIIVDAHANMYREKDETIPWAVALSSAAAFIEEAFIDRAARRGVSRAVSSRHFRRLNYNHPGHKIAMEQNCGGT